MQATTTAARLRSNTAVRLYVAVGVVITLVVAGAPAMWTPGPAPRRPNMVLDWLLGNWLWWDGGWYTQIAQHGYSFHPHTQSSVAFFPAYPTIVRVLAMVVPSVHLVAVLVTIASGIAALVLFQRWCELRLTSVATTWAVTAMAVYPYAWFLYGAAYADALFLAATIGAFLLVERGHPWAAGVCGFVATAARPTGIAVLIGLLAVVVTRRTRHKHDYGVAVAGLGLVAWCVWLHVRFGRPFAFVEVESAPGWDRSPGPDTWFKARFFHVLTHDSVAAFAPLALQALLCIAFVLAVPVVGRRFGRGYALFVAIAVVLPTITTNDFMGTGRYLLIAFPVFALVGERLERLVRLRLPYVLVSAGGLVMGASLFATGHYMA